MKIGRNIWVSGWSRNWWHKHGKFMEILSHVNVKSPSSVELLPLTPLGFHHWKHPFVFLSSNSGSQTSSGILSGKKKHNFCTDNVDIYHLISGKCLNKSSSSSSSWDGEHGAWWWWWWLTDRMTHQPLGHQKFTRNSPDSIPRYSQSQSHFIPGALAFIFNSSSGTSSVGDRP